MTPPSSRTWGHGLWPAITSTTATFLVRPEALPAAAVIRAGAGPGAPPGAARRWLVFNAVGLLGVGVQLVALWLLTRTAGLHYLPATALAVEAAILHNFLWHQRWTWADRVRDAGPWRLAAARLARFHLANGAVSLAGGLGLMGLLVGVGGLPVLPANVVAIVACSVVNFLLGDRWVFRRAGLA